MNEIIGTLDPRARSAFERFYDAQLSDGLLDAALKQAVARRLDTLSSLEAGGPLPDVSDLPAHGETGPTGVALDYVDHFSANYQDIPEAVWTALDDTFTTPELTELSWTIAVYRGLTRVRGALSSGTAPSPPIG